MQDRLTLIKLIKNSCAHSRKSDCVRVLGSARVFARVYVYSVQFSTFFYLFIFLSARTFLA